MHALFNPKAYFHFLSVNFTLSAFFDLLKSTATLSTFVTLCDAFENVSVLLNSVAAAYVHFSRGARDSKIGKSGWKVAEF